MEGFLWDDLRTIFIERSEIAKVPNGIEKLPKILIA